MSGSFGLCRERWGPHGGHFSKPREGTQVLGSQQSEEDMLQGHPSRAGHRGAEESQAPAVRWDSRGMENGNVGIRGLQR